MATVPISAKKIYKDADTLEIVKVAYHLDPQAFVDTFAKIGIPITDANAFLPYLAKLIDTGGDAKGELIENGKKIYFNGMNVVLHKIPVKNQSIIKSGVKIS